MIRVKYWHAVKVDCLIWPITCQIPRYFDLVLNSLELPSRGTHSRGSPRSPHQRDPLPVVVLERPTRGTHCRE